MKAYGNREIFGARVAALMGLKRLSKIELARRIGASHGYVGRIVRGVSWPTVSFALAIARELGVSLEALADPALPVDELVKLATVGPPKSLTPEEPLPGIRGEFVHHIVRTLRTGDHQLLAAYGVTGNGGRTCCVIRDGEEVYWGVDRRKCNTIDRRKVP